MKGHINATCPNRYTTRFRDLDRYSDCERCNSRLHRTNECPSWWRLYEYVTDEENTRVTKLREEKKTLALGNGGEGYIGDDPWCYNCGSRGHWGDDCDELPHRDHRPEEPSAFSLENIRSGPFYDPNKESIKKARIDDNKVEEYLGYNDWAKGIPEDVGKQSRKKNKARLERREQEQEQGDEDDWFGRPGREIRIRGEARRGIADENGTRKGSKMSFGKSIVDAGKRLGIQDSKPPSLLSRISDDRRTGDVRPRGSRDRRDDDHRHYSRDDRDHRNRPRRDRDRDREYDDERNRPRYRGGYAR
jgi:protein AIR1/2